jgi:hypothetical protein
MGTPCVEQQEMAIRHFFMIAKQVDDRSLGNLRPCHGLGA